MPTTTFCCCLCAMPTIGSWWLAILTNRKLQCLTACRMCCASIHFISTGSKYHCISWSNSKFLKSLQYYNWNTFNFYNNKLYKLSQLQMLYYIYIRFWWKLAVRLKKNKHRLYEMFIIFTFNIFLADLSRKFI